MSLTHWNKVAQEYANALREGKDKGRARYDPSVIDLLGEVSGKRVLDAGCGEGYWMRRLVSMEANVTGVDGSAELVRIAADTLTSSTRLLVSDLTCALPLPDESFDIVLCNMVLMDLMVIGVAIQEFARVLAPDGYLVFSITHPCFFVFDWLKDNTGRKLHKAVSNYICESASPMNFWGETIHYHRPLEFYFAELEKVGFVVEALREIQMCDDDGLPSFLVVRARSRNR